MKFTLLFVLFAVPLMSCAAEEGDVGAGREVEAAEVSEGEAKAERSGISLSWVQPRQLSWQDGGSIVRLNVGGGLDSVVSRLNQGETDQADLKDFAQYLYGHSFLDRALAVEKLAKLPDPVFEAFHEPLAAAVTDRMPPVRYGAIRVLAERGTERDRQWLGAMRWSADKRTASIVQSLGLPEVKPKPELLKLADVEPLQREYAPPAKPFADHLSVADEDFLPEPKLEQAKAEVQRLIGELKEGTRPQALKQYLDYLYSPDWRVRVHAVQGTEKISGEAFRALEPILVAALTDIHPNVQVAAVDMLEAHPPNLATPYLPMLRYAKVKEIAEAALE